MAIALVAVQSVENASENKKGTATKMSEIWAGDSFELLPEVADGSVDMVLTDPPYGIANEVIITRSRNTQKFGKAKAITHDMLQHDILFSQSRYDAFRHRMLPT